MCFHVKGFSRIEEHPEHPIFSGSCRTLAKALREAYTRSAGVPSAEVCIRRNGRLVAYLQTDWRGQVMEVEIHGPRFITPMNPGALCLWLSDANRQRIDEECSDIFGQIFTILDGFAGVSGDEAAEVASRASLLVREKLNRAMILNR